MKKPQQCNNRENAQDKPKVFLLAGPVIEKPRPDCPAIGAVAYPPHLLLWDIAREGEAAVRGRIRRALAEPRDDESDEASRMNGEADRVLAARLFGVCCPAP